VRVQTPSLSVGKAQEVQKTLADRAGIGIDEVSRNEVGPSWGNEISNKARNALIVFLISSSEADQYESKALGQIVSTSQAEGEILTEEQLLSLSNLYSQIVSGVKAGL